MSVGFYARRQRFTGILSRRPNASNASSTSYTAAMIAALYKFPKVTLTADSVIAILELGGGFNVAQVNAEMSAMGLPAPVITQTSVRGATNSPGGAADTEVFLDVIVAAAAYSYMTGRAAQLLVIWAPNDANGIGDAITAAATSPLKPTTLSCSWGGPENSWTAASIAYTENALASASKVLTFYAAAGDNGSGDGETGNNVDYPGSSAYAVSCGGTSIKTSGTAITQESVWNDGSQGGASGGGYSSLFAVPAFQTKFVPTGTRGRGVPDISADADPDTGYNLGSAFGVVGGTSAVAPLMASLGAVLYAVTGKPFNTATMYALPESVFNDVVTGSDGAYSATVGWDAASGLGSPIGTTILVAMGGTVAPPVTPTPPTNPTPPVSPTPPVAPTPLFSLTFPQTLPPNHLVEFRVNKTIPAGTYPVGPAVASNQVIAHVSE